MYRDKESRESIRQRWATADVPGYMRAEVAPLVPLIPRAAKLVALDIGANKGFWSKAFLKSFPGAVSHIYMIDPSPENVSELENKKDNLIFSPEDFRLLSAHNFAAGATNGAATLYTNEDGSPLGSLYPHKVSGQAGANMGVILDTKISTAVKTVDDFIAEQGISHVDIMKMDTEGHEFDILTGSIQALKNQKIDCLFWEFGMHQVESRHFFIDFYEYLNDLNYDLYFIKNGAAQIIKKYSYAYENFTTNFNFAATRRSAVPEWFSEEKYLSDHPDVKASVEAKTIPSGLHHWLHYGRNEGRRLRR
ncbi:FkbM family methyltransferase [Labrys sp. LIt4]|uniref:FkbM family methyltransferase n=1 Tax=Labrys sp. LIt4 TaxID=2821355 RepID=UPI001AE013CE|nr:FkbM family methyltransferase [Labrys sp. LIt4]MBP0579452.1 FkbM family methyltransferase [Labrys sp. LIt4]